MASAITSVRGTAQLLQKCYTHDPGDATTAAYIAWLPFKGFEWLMAAVGLVSGTGLLTVKLFAASDSSGTGATVIKSHSDPTVADAAGDVVYIECTVEMAKEVLSTATHVSVEVDCDSAGDIAFVSYVFGGAHREYSAKTADQIA